MVKELILDRDRVVLPGLGSFVAEIMPSTFSDKGYTINPPYRRLYFRSRPDQGDDISDFYASSNKLEPEVARRIILEFTSELKKILQEKKIVVFPGLGRLRATKENHLFFVDYEDLDIYPEGFGLEPISLKTHQETSEQLSAAVVNLKTMLDSVPEPVPVLEPEQIHELESEAEKESENEPEQEMEPASEPEPAPAPEPEAELKTAPVQLSEAPVQEAKEAAKPKKSAWAILFRVVLSIIITAFVLLAAYVAAAHLYPEFIDKILYSPEELDIIRHME